MIDRQTPEDVIYNAIVEAARSGRRCPTNGQLAGMIGASSCATPVRILAKLSRAGKVVVISGNSSRVVDIPAFGIGTAGLMPDQHWRERRGQSLATHTRPLHGEAPSEVARVAAAPKVSAPFTEARFVSRDPCPMCGIRGDLGCKHSEARNGA